MAPHSSNLAWKIPWTEEPGGLQSMGSRRVEHDWATSLSLFTFMHQRRKWQPTPVFLPGESQGRWSLVGCRLWGHTESDTPEATQQQRTVVLGFPGDSDSKPLACDAGDQGLIPGWGSSPRAGNGTWRISWTEEPGGLQSIRGVVKSWIWLSYQHNRKLV